MDLLAFFHKKEQLAPFNRGDKVQLKEDQEPVRLMYNKHYPNCACTEERWREAIEDLKKNYSLGGIHTVSKVTEGTPAAGGWFVYVDGNDQIGFHGNIFELVKE